MWRFEGKTRKITQFLYLKNLSFVLLIWFLVAEAVWVFSSAWPSFRWFLSAYVCGSVVKNPPAMAGDPGLIPGSGRSPGWTERLPTPVFWPGDPLWRVAKSLQRVGHDWASFTSLPAYKSPLSHPSLLGNPHGLTPEVPPLPFSRAFNLEHV